MASTQRHTPSPSSPWLDGQPILALTSGEPAGIGPDICLQLAGRALPARVVVLGDKAMLQERATLLGAEVRFRDYGDYAAAAPVQPDTIDVLHIPLRTPSVAGCLDTRNARYVLELLKRALAGCRQGEFAGMVTAPVHKGIINDAGIAFTGHTEFLDEQCGSPGVVMMLAGGGLRVALATTHLALAQVPRALSRPGLERTLRILVAGLQRRFAIAEPRLLVAGLNPHGGEGGHLGREEIDVIAPVIAKLRGEGLRIEGPLPADTLFVPARLKDADCALAMYHDQGLPVLKYASFGGGVNITLGLPIIRTSVDHGTALELAGTGKADAGSLFEAIRMAADMARHEAA
mgnify:CR=1 FL=1